MALGTGFEPAHGMTRLLAFQASLLSPLSIQARTYTINKRQEIVNKEY